MQAYRGALGDDNTSFVLSPDSEFFRFFNDPGTALQSAGGARDATVDTKASDVATQPEAPPGASVGIDRAPAATAVE